MAVIHIDGIPDTAQSAEGAGDVPTLHPATALAGAVLQAVLVGEDNPSLTVDTVVQAAALQLGDTLPAAAEEAWNALAALLAHGAVRAGRFGARVLARGRAQRISAVGRA